MLLSFKWIPAKWFQNLIIARVCCTGVWEHKTFVLIQTIVIQFSKACNSRICRELTAWYISQFMVNNGYSKCIYRPNWEHSLYNRKSTNVYRYYMYNIYRHSVQSEWDREWQNWARGEYRAVFGRSREGFADFSGIGRGKRGCCTVEASAKLSTSRGTLREVKNFLSGAQYCGCGLVPPYSLVCKNFCEFQIKLPQAQYYSPRWVRITTRPLYSGYPYVQNPSVKSHTIELAILFLYSRSAHCFIVFEERLESLGTLSYSYVIESRTRER